MLEIDPELHFDELPQALGAKVAKEQGYKELAKAGEEVVEMFTNSPSNPPKVRARTKK